MTMYVLLNHPVLAAFLVIAGFGVIAAAVWYVLLPALIVLAVVGITVGRRRS